MWLHTIIDSYIIIKKRMIKIHASLNYGENFLIHTYTQ